MDSMLTTFDNPWDPFTRFDEWFAFDETVGSYHTCGYLARVTDAIKEKYGYSDELATDVAMELIILDEPDTYKKIDKQDI